MREIAEACRLLEEHPLAGRARNEVRPGLRSVVTSPYVVFYRVPEDIAEIVRVLKPGGRLVIADFKRKQERQGRAARFHAGGSSIQDLAAMVSDAGFSEVETEEMQPPRFSAFPGAGLVRAYKS